MTYDAIGNMLTRGNITYRWIMGRKLAGVNNGKNIQYFYDHTGSRTKKVVDGTATEYRMAGELLVSEITNGQTFWYTYDSNANLVSIIIGGKNYFYVRNLQNDIIALIDEDGNTVVNYTYDSWGKILSITGSLKGTVGQQNPFRYRGYYYDKETGMYYLKNRYYDPELRRFICADGQVNNGSLGKNMYAYCENNPANLVDYSGCFAASIGALLAGTVKKFVVTVAKKVASAVAGFVAGFVAHKAIDFVGSIDFFASKEKEEVKIDADAILRSKKQRKDFPIYRYGGTTPGNLTPQKKDWDTGHSFSTIPPRPGRAAAVTTINKLNATGVVFAEQDGPTLVTVLPRGATVEAWTKMGTNSIWTQAVKSVVVKWDGGH